MHVNRRPVTVVLALAFAVAACGGPAAPSQPSGSSAQPTVAPESASTGPSVPKIRIGWTPPDITGVFKTATDYFEKAAAQAGEHGIDVEIISRSPATHTDFADQVAIVEGFITQKVDAIAISPSDTEAIKPAIREANKAGIPVIMVNLLEKQDGIEIASYIGFDNTQGAAVSAYAVLDYFGGPGVLGAGPKVEAAPADYLDLDWWKKTYQGADLSQIKANGVIIEGIAGTFFSQARVDGFNSVIKLAPNAKILAQPIAADWNREKGVSAAETFLSRFPAGQLDFIWAASNEMGLGAMLTAEREGRLDASGGLTQPEAGKVSIFTNDSTPESTDAIRSGKLIAETTHGFPDWGWFGTEFAVRLACGLDVPATQDIRPRIVYQANADQFYPQPQLPEIDWAGIAASCKS